MQAERARWDAVGQLRRGLWGCAAKAVPRPFLGLVFGLTLAAAPAGHADDAAAAPHEIRSALRTLPDGVESQVTLPDYHRFPPSQRTVESVRYRMRTDQGPAPARGQSLYFPGLRSHARISLNGHVLEDWLAPAGQAAPRSFDAIRLIRIPEEFLQPGINELDLIAADTRAVSISRAWIGPTAALTPLRDRKVLLGVIGPLLVAMTVGCLALFVLVLWLRRRSEPMYGYFGVAALCWAAHTAWTVIPSQLLPGIHYAVWWTVVYTFFVSMLVIFCIRFAGWHWPRFDRALWALTAATPLVLYAAAAAGGVEQTFIVWRFGLVLLASIGLTAVVRYAWRKRNIDSALLTATGVASVAFGLRDWLTDFGADNNPAYLTPYAGLLFLLLVGWMLIDRFVLATRELEVLNIELESRVTSKSEQLVAAVEQMRRARDAAEAANRAKSTFLASASHDLRQPIHALGLYLAALEVEQLTAKQLALTDRMTASVAAMDSMFGALLDISRMDAGAVTAHAQSFELMPLLSRLIEEFAPQARAKQLRLSLRAGKAPSDLHAQGDPILLERVLSNLIGNAVKYTHRGGVLVSMRMRGSGSRHWRVEVWDTGVGISAAEQEHVFEEFYQVGNPERDRANGLGLGLAIVRRLVDLMQLPLTLVSVAGRGSRFALDLPATSTAPNLQVETRRAGSLAGMVVAVIEDDREVRHSMGLLLAHWGCVTCEGSDADDVLARVREIGVSAVQAIVADYRLQHDRSGLDEIGRLWAAWGCEVPALLVTGDSAPQCIAELHASGHDWLSKPVPAARLRSWLQAVAVTHRPAEVESLAT